VSVTLVDGLVAPHGGVLVDRLSSAPPGFDCLETVTATPRELADLDLISVGARSCASGRPTARIPALRGCIASIASTSRGA